MDIPTVRLICSRPSSDQTRALLDELEIHPHLARGRSRVNNRRESDKLWRDLTERLNNLPGCQKTIKQWQKFWADKKSAVKKQVAAKQALGLSISAAAFGNTELRIINLIDKSDATEEDYECEPQSPVTILDNLGTMSDDRDEEYNNPLLEIPLESDMILDVKKEPKVDKNNYPRTRNSELRRQRLIKSRAQPANNTLNSNKLLKKLLQIEKKRAEYEEQTARSLASIAACMKRQEEATQKLTTVLLEIIPRSGLTKYCLRTSPSTDQVSALLEELEKNPYLAHGKLRNQGTHLWNAIGARLNGIEGCKKTPKKWAKYWSDKKLTVTRLLKTVTEDSNGSDTAPDLTDIERRVIALLENPHLEEPKTEYEAHGSPMSGLTKYCSKTRTSPPSTDQVSALLEELERNPYLAHGKLRSQGATRMWNAIGARLNGIEGCKKTPKKWAKYWSDKKLIVKRLLKTVTEDSNGSSTVPALTDIEQRVTVLLANPHLEEPKTEYEAPGSPMEEIEYLDNDYLSDLNEDNIILAELKNPLKSITAQPCTMKEALRGVQKPKTQLKKKRTPFMQFCHRVIKMEENCLTHHKSIVNSLAEIESCMARQEQATQELSRLILRAFR